MSKRSHHKHTKIKRVLYLLGYRDYFDGRCARPSYFDILKRKEQKAYLKGQKAARRTYLRERNSAKLHGLKGTAIRGDTTL